MHYINNPDFLEAIKAYKAEILLAEQEERTKPIVPNYIGDCILKIANRLSLRPNFINYTYRDEMIGDGIENALVAVENFDPQKSSNPFAYFTQIIYFAFIRRIHKEKKQTLIKSKIIMDMPFDEYDIQDHDEDGCYVNSYFDFMQKSGFCNDIIKNEEVKVSKKKNKSTLVDHLEYDE
jgi:hypothetical protein